MTRKSLIALAVSAAFTAPAAHAAEFEVSDDTTINIGGTVEPLYQSVTTASGDSQSEFDDNDSTLEFEAEHAFSQNATGFVHIEYEWLTDESGTGSGPEDLDSAWAGVKGSLGMIRAGTSDTLYEDNVAELIDEFENGTLSEEDDGGEGNQIRYVSPSFGGFSVGVETRIEGDGEGLITDPNGEDFGDGGTGLSAVARFDADNWGVIAGADNRGAVPVDTNGNGLNDQYADETTAGLGGYFELGNFRLSSRVTSESAVNDNDTDYFGVMGSFDYGTGNVHVGVQEVSPDQGNDRTEFAAIVYHEVFDNLEAFVNVARYDRANDVGDLNEVGVIYSF